MIYIKRIGWFLLWGLGFLIIFVIGSLVSALIEKYFGALGLLALLALLIISFAIADVRIDKYLEKKRKDALAKFNNDLVDIIKKGEK